MGRLSLPDGIFVPKAWDERPIPMGQVAIGLLTTKKSLILTLSFSKGIQQSTVHRVEYG